MCRGVRKNNFLVGTLLRIFWGSHKNLFGGCLMSKGVILVLYFQQFGIFLGYGQNYLYFLGAPSYPICLTFGLQSRWWDRNSL